MRVIIQRITSASVSIDGEVVGKINSGFLLLVGVTHTDTEQDVKLMARKVAQMRVFSDSEGKMNLALREVDNAAVLSISQFTLYADCRHGNRPAFIQAARPEQAEPLYNLLNRTLREEYGLRVETGRFGADMKVSLCNDGPVTIVLDSREL